MNCILGMSFLSSAKMIIDLSDNVLQTHLLDIEPFEIIMKKSTHSSPNIVPMNNESHHTLESITAAIDTAKSITDWKKSSRGTKKGDPEELRNQGTFPSLCTRTGFSGTLHLQIGCTGQKEKGEIPPLHFSP